MILPGLGTLLQAELTPPGTFTTIAQRVSVTPPPISNSEKDDTNLDDLFKRFSSGILDVGQVKMKIQYDPAAPTHQAMTTMVIAGASNNKNFKLIFPDHVTLASRSVWAFSAWAVSFELGEATEEGNQEADVTLRLTTIPTFTPRLP